MPSSSRSTFRLDVRLPGWSECFFSTTPQQHRQIDQETVRSPSAREKVLPGQSLGDAPQGPDYRRQIGGRCCSVSDAKIGATPAFSLVGIEGVAPKGSWRADAAPEDRPTSPIRSLAPTSPIRSQGHRRRHHWRNVDLHQCRLKVRPRPLHHGHREL